MEEFPSIDHSLLHFPSLRGSSQSDPSSLSSASAPSSDGETLSPASLLFQHLASPLHFVNTHFNGHGRPPGSDQEKAVTEQTQRSLEALSEEIVSTAISTVVQNTLSALLRSSEDSEEPTLAEFLPNETPPGALETAAPMVAEEEESRAEDTLVPTEDEDFELLDQSELEQADEELDPSFSDRNQPLS